MPAYWRGDLIQMRSPHTININIPYTLFPAQ